MAGRELKLAISIGGKLDGTLGSAINAAERQLGSLGKNINTAVNAAAGASVAGSVALVADSTKKAIEYEKAMAGVAKVVDDCRDANGNLTDTYHELSDGILDMSTQIPMAAKDIAAIVESAGQSNIAKEELLDFAESAAKMGIAFDTTAEQAGDWMAQWRTSMGLTQPEVETLADQINYLGNTSSEQAIKLAEVVSRVGSLGQIAGLSGGEVAALAAAMPGVEAEIAATGIKNMTKAMTAGSAATKRQQTVLAKLGFNATDLAERMQVDAKGAILDFLGALQQLPEAEQSAALTQYFGSESVAAIAPLLANLDNLREQFDKVGNSSRYAGSMQKEYEAAADTTENKIQLLTNAIEKEQIKLGQKILPLIGDASEQLAEKMPELFETISEGLEKIIPKAEKLAEYLIDNSDKIVSGAVKIGKAYAGIKVGTGITKAVTTTTKLGKSLATVAKSGGMAKTIQTVITGFTGAGSAAGTFSTAAVGAISKVASALLPSAGIMTGLVMLGTTIDYIQNRKYRYADGMLETVSQVAEASEGLQKYNHLAREVSELRLVIADPNSSVEQIDTAKQRLEEIAQMLGEEYNLVINADTSELETALNMAQQMERTELINSATEFTQTAQSGAEQYKTDIASIPNLQAAQKSAEETQIIYSELVSSAELYRSSFENGLSSQQEYISNMDELYQRAKQAGIEFQYIGENLDEYSVDSFITSLNGGLQTTTMQLSGVNEELGNALQRTGEYSEAVEKAGTYLTQALASDINAGNSFGSDTDIDMLTQLGQAMVTAGIETDALAVSFAAAKSGYTDFATAIANGKAEEMANSFLEYSTAIGNSVESAVSGAALISNGFENVTQATERGEDAINAVIADMQRFGTMNGLFDGIITPDGVADKLSDMAHALNLIPENKSVAINATGNFEVISEAENQIASLKSQGNINVAVNANGDISIFNEATQETSLLRSMGAVSLSVNASGNIDVLNEAGNIIATIDSKSAQVSVNGQANMGAVEMAKTTVESMPTTKNVDITATGNAASTAEQTQSAIGLIPPTKMTFLNANGNAITMANNTRTAIQQIPISKTIPVNISGSAVSTATRIKHAVNNLPTSKTITINIKTNGSVPKVASGIRNAPGGTYMVNDQNISDPREVIEHDGLRYWYEGRNVITTLPRGANVYSASESRAFIDGSHRNGLKRVPFDGYIAELHRNEQILTDDEAEDYRNGGVFARAIDRLRYTRSEHDSAAESGTGGSYTISYSPNIVIEGNADEAAINRAFRQSYEEFKNYMERYNRDLRRTSFSA